MKHSISRTNWVSLFPYLSRLLVFQHVSTQTSISGWEVSKLSNDIHTAVQLGVRTTTLEGMGNTPSWHPPKKKFSPTTPVMKCAIVWDTVVFTIVWHRHSVLCCDYNFSGSFINFSENTSMKACVLEQSHLPNFTWIQPSPGITAHQ